jgi:transposase InsO family protein
VSLGVGETIMSKIRFEERLWEMAAAEISHLHSDNGVFTANMFHEDCKSKHQPQIFSGVGAQHQNSLAERAIQAIVYMARTFMVHVSLHSCERGVDDLALWGFPVKHAAWVYNHVPNRLSGLTPLELLTKTKSDHRDLLRSHVWGCPVFVLDPKLQDGKKIPKWNRRS